MEREDNRHARARAWVNGKLSIRWNKDKVLEATEAARPR